MSTNPPDPTTIFIANDLKVAEAVIEFLASHDIPAEVFNAAPRLDSEPVTGVSDIATSEEFEVRVADPAKRAAANDLLDTAQKAALIRSVREKRLQRTGTVSVVCEECGKTSEWPASAMGTTETCPHCMAYMDVPDPDDDWSGVDFGQPEE